MFLRLSESRFSIGERGDRTIMASRKIEDLIPEMQELYKAFANAMAEANIPLLVTCTRRSQEEQDALYEQGRTKPGKIVTWTHKSKHILGEAFDIVILKEGKPSWDLKVDVNDDEIPDYQEAADIGRKVGLRAGADFKDFPHFEFKEEAR